MKIRDLPIPDETLICNAVRMMISTGEYELKSEHYRNGKLIQTCINQDTDNETILSCEIDR